MTTETTYPKFGLDARIPAFLERFYRISDDENGATEYTKLFTDDVTFQFTSLRMSGIEGIKKLREIMWEGNVPRQHDVQKVFSCDGSGKEVMMYGTVTMNLPKEDITLPWAGHMTLDDKDGTLRVRDYHVYADNAPLFEAKARQ